jgi:hypothetical protein
VNFVGVCFKRVERRNVPKVLPRNFAAFAATFGTVSTEMKHTHFVVKDFEM